MKVLAAINHFTHGLCGALLLLSHGPEQWSESGFSVATPIATPLQQLGLSLPFTAGIKIPSICELV